MSKTNLITEAKRSVLWHGGFRIFHAVLQFALTIILARLLSPKDYGSYAIVAGLIGFLNSVSFDNFIYYILQVRNEEDVHYQDHFTAAVAMQLLIFVVTNIVAMALWLIPRYQNIAGYLHTMSPMLVLGAIGGYRYVVLEREMDWSRYRLLQALGVVLAFVSTISLAAAGAGVYALIIGPFAKYAPPAVDLFFIVRWRPTWAFSWKNYRPPFLFGINRLASQMLLRGRTMVETNTVALFTSLATLGFLNRAMGISQMIMQQFATITGQSLYPVLTKIEPASPKYQRASGLVIQGMAWAVTPCVAFLSLVADPMVRSFYGEKWLPCAVFIPATLCFGAIASIGQVGYYLMLAGCQQSRCLAYDGLRFVLLVLCLASWIEHDSVMMYLVFLVIAEATCALVLFIWLYRLRLINFEGLFSAFFPTAISTAISLAVVIPIIGKVESTFLFSPRVIVAGFVFVASYLIIIRVAFAHQLRSLLRITPMPGLLRQMFFLSAEART